MPHILDVAIGIIFVFLLLSLVVTALNEVILSQLDQRAAFLKKGLREMLRDLSVGLPGRVPAPGTLNLANLLQHGLISSLSRGTYDPTQDNTMGVPSYIPGKSFVLALLGLLTNGANIAQFSELRPLIDKLENAELRQTLRALYDDAAGDLDHFKANLENWFNESMDRIGGWYKRRVQLCLLALALALAVLCNVNTLHLTEALSTDDKLREETLRQAVAYADAHHPATGTPTLPTADDPAKDPKIGDFRAAVALLHGTGLPLGWGAAQRAFFFDANGALLPFQLLSALAGWTVAGLAASLGAPFWFDTLNRFIDLRANGRAPEERDSTAPKKRAVRSETYKASGDAPVPGLKKHVGSVAR